MSFGYPIQIFLFALYPLLHLYWKLFALRPAGSQIDAAHEACHGRTYQPGDDHGAFTQYGLITNAGLENLVRDGQFLRQVFEDGSCNQRHVSGDVVVAWCFAATHHSIDLEQLKPTVLNLARNYLKNLGTLSWDECNQGQVSNRCNNFGVNFCPDSDFFQLGQPMAGPQFYTSSALFALASKFSLKWKFVFWLHWLLLGGWYWCFSPVIYTKRKPLHYARDIVMKSLWVHRKVFGDRFWIRWPMRRITFRMASYKNALFYAMMGDKTPALALPEVVNAFFSQKRDASSKCRSGEMNPGLRRAILEM